LSTANVVSGSAHVAASLAVAAALFVEHTRFLRASTGLMIYWLVSAVVLAIQIRSFVLDEYSDAKPVAFTLLVLQFAMTIGNFVLENLTFAKDEGGNRQRPFPFGGNVNVFSRVTYWYMQQIMITGAKRPLEMSDLWLPSKSQSADVVHTRFITRWRAELKSNERSPSLYRTLVAAFYPIMVISVAQSVIAILLSFAQPLVLDQLITFVNDRNRPAGIGYLLAAVVFAAGTVSLLVNVQGWISTIAVGYQVRSALSVAVFQKSLRLSNGARKMTSNGAISNLMCGQGAQSLFDVQLNCFFFVPRIRSSDCIIISISLTMYLLWQQIGPACLAGVAVILLSMPLQGFIGKATGKYQERHLSATDRRVKLIDESMTSISLLKLYAWDVLFGNRINAARTAEVKALAAVGFVKAIEDILGGMTPLVVALVSFLAYSIIHRTDGQPLTANKIFVSFNLFSMLSEPIGCIGLIFTVSAAARTSLTRIRQFLLLEELDDCAVNRSNNSRADPAVQVVDGCFAWEDKADPVLKDVELSFPRGTLTAVLGRVGQGKSSLVSALLGDMYKASGTVAIDGSVAYVSQQPWIENLTIKDSILFGSEFDTARYKAVIEACSLCRDLAEMEAGDQTEIGERGTNLSGGQKQRIQLARAAYNNADIYILDDPLSAVDANVENEIFQNLLGPNGLLRDKTRILVTHGINHLNQCDKVVVLDANKVSEEGTFEELMQRDGSIIRGIVEDVAKADEQAARKREAEVAAPTVEGRNDLKEDEVRIDGGKRETSGGLDETRTEAGEAAGENRPEPLKGTASGKLTETEKLSRGQVSRSVYWAYARAAGIGWVTFNLLLLVSAQVMSIGSTIWLERWTSDIGAADSTPRSSAFYLIIYAAIVVAASVLAYGTNVTMNTVTGLNASRKIHEDMLRSVMRAPMAWFDMTPTGRITNRFTQDIRTVDETLVSSFTTFFTNLANAMAIVGIISAVTPLFLFLVVPVGVAFYFLQAYYLKSSREIQRLNMTASSPIFSLAGTTIAGAAVIRSFQKQQQYFAKYSALQDVNQSGMLSMIASNKWLQVRIEFLGTVISGGAALFAVIERSNLSPGMAGLSLSYAFLIVNYLYTIMLAYGEIENSSTSLERLVEYSSLESEGPQETTFPVPPAWPDQGAIVFTDYSLRYRQTMPLALKNISFSVNAGEKIGIVGRTGAGKSSLSAALFRIVEPATGAITVDGVDITAVGLTDLRGRMTIIPQEPILFAGTLRENLDPTGKSTDEEMWSALEKAHLKKRGEPAFTADEGKGLDAEIRSGGENFSVGERQLFCLARAILRRRKVLVLDEATAGIDLQTDALLQATIRSEFKDVTVLTIAHRIRTVLDSDRVLVMDAGRIAEFDTPARLRADPNSAFAKLVESAGL
ncbi:multi drug resistance-associated protein MRP, partial [Zopfochytrium polystomum]